MPVWEYAKINLNEVPRKGDDIDHLLTPAGEAGWELVTITTNCIAYLKRQLDIPSARRRAASSRESKS